MIQLEHLKGYTQIHFPDTGCGDWKDQMAIGFPQAKNEGGIEDYKC